MLEHRLKRQDQLVTVVQPLRQRHLATEAAVGRLSRIAALSSSR